MKAWGATFAGFATTWAASWVFWALLSACFAALTAIFAKIGVANVNSDFATLIRTVIIVAVLAAILAASGQFQPLAAISLGAYLFLALSGLATGASWIDRLPIRVSAAALSYTRSMIVAVPMPAPMQSVTSAVALPVRSSSSSAVPSSIAPVAPSGCPIAIDPAPAQPATAPPAAGIAPLLAKLLDQQAAAGLPPPYLPKDEGDDA